MILVQTGVGIERWLSPDIRKQLGAHIISWEVGWDDHIEELQTMKSLKLSRNNNKFIDLGTQLPFPEKKNNAYFRYR